MLLTFWLLSVCMNSCEKKWEFILKMYNTQKKLKNVLQLTMHIWFLNFL